MTDDPTIIRIEMYNAIVEPPLNEDHGAGFRHLLATLSVPQILWFVMIINEEIKRRAALQMDLFPEEQIEVVDEQTKRN